MSRVVDHLLGRGRPFLVLPSPGATSVRATAEVHGVDLREVIRTEVLITAGGPVLLLLPALRPLDLALARTAAGDRGARLATHAEIRSFAPGCEVRAVPPVSLLMGAPTIVDPSLAGLAQVVFPAGRCGVLVCMEREDLLGDDPYVVAPLTRARDGAAPPAPPPARHALLAHDDLVPVHVAEERARGGRGADVA